MVGDGHHNPGQDCMNNCHNHGFTFAGTLYNSTGGTSPVVGAHIVVTDANNQKIDIYSQQNGNFYTSAAVTFPLTVLATSCPDIQHMTAQVVAGGGGCNSCHLAGGDGGIMHLP
jgi:hypothetical protein